MLCIQNSKRRASSAFNPRKRESRAKSAPQNGFPKRSKHQSELDDTEATPAIEDEINLTKGVPSSISAEESLGEHKLSNSHKDADHNEVSISVEKPVESNEAIQVNIATVQTDPNSLKIFGSATSSKNLPSFDDFIQKIPNDNASEEKGDALAGTGNEASDENTMDNDDTTIFKVRVATKDDKEPQKKKKNMLRQKKTKLI